MKATTNLFNYFLDNQQRELKLVQNLTLRQRSIHVAASICLLKKVRLDEEDFEELVSQIQNHLEKELK